MKVNRIIGIDEVGRGPIAGPVAVCAFACHGDFVLLENDKKLPLRDSKKLSEIQREQWFKILSKLKSAGKCDFAVAMIAASEIDRIGIARALRLCVSRTLTRLETSEEETIILDGSLYAPKEFTNQRTIIKGDENEMAITLASIIAKVTRDRYMTKLHEEYPDYGFKDHKGYGTKAHYDVLAKHGPTPIHRKSFL